MFTPSSLIIIVKQLFDDVHQLADYICFTNQSEEILNKSLTFNTNYELGIGDNLWSPEHKENYTQTIKERKIIERLTTITEDTFLAQIRKDMLGGPNTCAFCFCRTATKAVIPCCHVAFCDICVKNKNRCAICKTLIRKIWSGPF